MKTLAEIEPRVRIGNDFEGLNPIVINAGGSYYLGEDILAFHGNHGIEITASDVSIDLNGFKIEGNIEVGSLDGIHVGAGLKNVTVRNGTVKLFFGKGIEAGTCSNLRVEAVRLVGNGGGGLAAGLAAMVLDCVASGNQGDGFNLKQRSLIKGCIAESNGGDGIELDDANQARENNCSDNEGNGILVTGSSNFVTGNSVLGSSKNGIHCVGFGRGNRIDSNSVTYNLEIGIHVEGSDNQVTRNLSLGNSVAHYLIDPANASGAISNSPAAAGPWDNFQG